MKPVKHPTDGDLFRIQARTMPDQQPNCIQEWEQKLHDLDAADSPTSLGPGARAGVTNATSREVLLRSAFPRRPDHRACPARIGALSPQTP
jgi:hypothetical protein